jgi:hypothetical protein
VKVDPGSFIQHCICAILNSTKKDRINAESSASYINTNTNIHHWYFLNMLFENTFNLFVNPAHFSFDVLKRLVDWLIDYLGFYVPLKNFSLIWRRHHCRWRATKFRPMLDAQGLWAGRDLYRATPAVTRDLCFFGIIRRTAPFSRLLRHTRGCGGSILTRILTGGLIFTNMQKLNLIF